MGFALEPLAEIRVRQGDQGAHASGALSDPSGDGAFAIDVLACPGCGGRLRLLATIAHPPAIAKILRHLGLPAEVPVPAPGRRSDRLEWVVKNGFADWFMEEMKAGRAFFPLSVRA